MLIGSYIRYYMVDLVAITLHPVLQSLAFRLTASLSADLGDTLPSQCPTVQIVKVQIHRMLPHHRALKPYQV